jgi:hypothetical protein
MQAATCVRMRLDARACGRDANDVKSLVACVGNWRVVGELDGDVAVIEMLAGGGYEGQLWTKIKTHIGLKVIRTQNSVCVRIRAHTARF